MLGTDRKDEYGCVFKAERGKGIEIKVCNVVLVKWALFQFMCTHVKTFNKICEKPASKSTTVTRFDVSAPIEYPYHLVSL